MFDYDDYDEESKRLAELAKTRGFRMLMTPPIQAVNGQTIVCAEFFFAPPDSNIIYRCGSDEESAWESAEALLSYWGQPKLEEASDA